MTSTADLDLPMTLVGTYPPRRCGIATFTRDLGEATASASPGVSTTIMALTDPGGQYDYPDLVKYELRQGVKGDYARAAEFVNYSGVRVVSVQHEYGIFGGDDGAYVLDFLSALRVPAIATLHTVLKRPSESQRTIVEKMVRHCAATVVMSQVAADLLATSYRVDRRNVRVIPHGIPRMEPRDRAQLKLRFSIPRRRMLLTFGLLSPNKGIETAIRALPAIADAFPDVVYFVVGATHPVIARRDGEAYRTSLEREAERLGVRDRVVFRDQFVTIEELCCYLQAADVFISPYLNEAQVTSGALSYAMGAGAAVVSTPYWHAQELLADGRGRLFPFGDHRVLAREVTGLFASPGELDRVRTAAFELTRSMVWPRIGQAYLALATAAANSAQTRAPRRAPPRASALPELRLDHLLRLTDDTGIIQHATFTVPARSSGYCVDDNSRALIVALLADRVNPSTETCRLVTRYLSFLHGAQAADGSFKNFMTYHRVLDPSPPSEDCVGRAVWALGATVQLAADDGCRLLARDMFERALARTGPMGPRGTASLVLGLASVLAAEPAAAGAKTTLAALVDDLVRRFADHATDEWRWFEPTLSYDNAMIPLALFRAYLVTGERTALRVARDALDFLEEICFDADRMVLIGNAGWHKRGGVKAAADEQAIDAAAFVLAFRAAYLATGDHHYLQRMRESFAWFLGANRLGLPLYDATTAGCRDGLGPVESNQNQGAESTICFLMALLAMLELADEGLEHTDSPSSS